MKKWLVLLLQFFAPLVFASSSTDLTTILGNIHTMRADFTQTILDNRGKVAQKSVGKMALQRPGKFRWEVTKPIPQLIIANQTKLWIYDPDLEQVTIRSLKQAAGDTPAVLLSHNDQSIDADYQITELPQKSVRMKWFVLVPRAADSMFASIKMGFQNQKIEEMRLEDHIGHTTIIEFKKNQTNASVPDSLFVFKAAPNVDVIDETRKR